MSNLSRSVVLALMLLPVAAVPASADLIYSYTSVPFFFVAGDYTGVVAALYPNPVFDNGGDRITGSFVLSDSFVTVPATGAVNITAGVVSYSFSDGHQTLTEINSTAKFGFTWGQFGAPVWDGPRTRDNGLSWDIVITSATGAISSRSPNGGNLFERASSDGTAPFCGGAGYGVDHGGTNGGTTCWGGTSDIGVATNLLASWSWNMQRVPDPVPEPMTIVLVGLGIPWFVAVGRARRHRP